MDKMSEPEQSGSTSAMKKTATFVQTFETADQSQAANNPNDGTRKRQLCKAISIRNSPRKYLKCHWLFHITDFELKCYHIEEKYSIVKTVWEIKVRLYHLERSPIQPANQILTFNNQILKDEMLLKHIFAINGEVLKLHLYDKRSIPIVRPPTRDDVDYKRFMIKSLMNMGINRDMAHVALDATDYDLNDALDILKNL